MDLSGSELQSFVKEQQDMERDERRLAREAMKEARELEAQQKPMAKKNEAQQRARELEFESQQRAHEHEVAFQRICLERQAQPQAQSIEEDQVFVSARRPPRNSMSRSSRIGFSTMLQNILGLVKA